ncbi:iron complex transport system permease protein [Clostridium tetanomorphum]|uniref:FecCD family ABC transporter permease n=1 Tax=Clostridium tetanomorphum TaxID=1553 RepID=UPI000446B5B0|nr:iron ABC transporter permease [Clostridium tetanomorphum]KAJ52722.1 iron(III) dicitrate ABC transporter [Clostridium tetanomorphum DSM 665]MBP1863315.1 iron complex transport system permease protein [Clostridium tetanomorphum]NRS84423.1 iron complex transport system permease protein [Clostridium tetanomorphum]SQB92086.1 iron(III) dicitrate ABC transporter [Clostridium tetanomorphum]
MKRFIVFRKGKFSYIYEKRSVLIVVFALILSIVSILLSTSIGQKYIPILKVIEVLLGNSQGGDSLIINTIRLPRTLVAFLVGASLGISGAILQGVVKNPLADPNIIGITASGSVGALVFLTLFTDSKNNSLTISIFYMPVFAFAGALLSVLLIYFLAYKKGVTPYRLIFIGIAISGASKALTSILIINGPVIFIKEAQLWITGTVYGTSWINVKLLFIWFSCIYLITLIYIRELNVQSLDDSISTGLGNDVEKNRFILMILSAALASGAVAVGGGISFVGLIAPHICRKLTNSSFEYITPLSALIGGIIVVLSDIAARTLFFPLDLPVGIFTAGIGAPFFIYLLVKNHKSLKEVV